MNAPDRAVATAPTAGFVFVALDAITPSPTNPRKRFDEVALAELTASVRDHGVIQPILVRPIDPPRKGKTGYELVAGERRYRAAKAAGLAEIPAMVRALTDLQALELQVIENLQRNDLHPLEEAEGYERLMNAHGMTVDQVADKIGKSKAYVYARLKLTALCPAARKLFYDDKIVAATALDIARISPASEQERCLEMLKDHQRGGEPLSVRDARDLIHRNFMLRLAEAPFDPKSNDLVPGAGACTTCPKRTGNAPELFPDVQSADVCTDPVCYGEKKKVHIAQAIANAEASGQKVLRGKDAKALINEYRTGLATDDYVTPEQPNYHDAKQRTYKQILGKDAPSPTLIVHPKTGDLIEAWSRKEIAPILKAKGIGARRTETDTKARAQQKAQKEKAVLERKAREAVYHELRQAVTGLSPQLALVVARFAYDALGYEEKKRLLPMWGWVDAEVLAKGGWNAITRAKVQLDSLPPADLARFLVDAAVVGEMTNTNGKAENLFAAATAAALDPKAIHASAMKSAKAEEPAKPRKTTKSSERGKTTT